MTQSEQILEQIKSETQAAPKGASRFVACKSCGDISMWNTSEPAPAKCNKCGYPGGFYVGMSFGEVKKTFEDSKGTPTDAPSTPPATATPPTEGMISPPTAPLSEPIPAEKPKPKPKSRRKAPKKVEPAAEPIVVPDVQNGATLKEVRMASIAAMIESKGLNHLEYKPVGKAEIYAFGFTQWVNKLPTFTIQQITDTAESFGARFDKAKSEDGRVEMDVVRLTAIDPEALCNCLFRGNLISNFSAKNGPISGLSVGDKVEVGALVTKKGGLIYNVLRKI